MRSLLPSLVVEIGDWIALVARSSVKSSSSRRWISNGISLVPALGMIEKGNSPISMIILEQKETSGQILVPLLVLLSTSPLSTFRS